QFQTQSLSLAEFLAGLNLNVEIEEPKTGQLSRIAQLTERTNQFNFTTRRRSETELQQLWSGRQYQILTVSVSDRFGDYGLVGVLIWQTARDTIKVDTFLLSCRVLGKGIEHRMLARLGQIAQAQGVRWVQLPFIASARNKPALDFLESVGSGFRQGTDNATNYRFTVEAAAAVAFKPEQSPLVRTEKTPA